MSVRILTSKTNNNCSRHTEQGVTPGPDPCENVQCESWKKCVSGSCYCMRPSEANCPEHPTEDEIVCGSDGREYESYCNMKATACFFGRTINMKYSGPCPEESGKYSDDTFTQPMTLYTEIVPRLERSQTCAQTMI